MLNEGGRVTRAMLPQSLQLNPSEPLVPALHPPDVTLLRDLIGHPLAEIERLVIEQTLAHCAGSVPKAARLLALSPSTLYRKIEGWKAE